jgi:predicted DNA-binding transcriptional regulator AlpA
VRHCLVRVMSKHPSARRRQVVAPIDSRACVDLVPETEALQILGGSKPISKHTLYRGIAAGRFPRAVRIGPNLVRYVRAELEAVVRDAIAARAVQ